MSTISNELPELSLRQRVILILALSAQRGCTHIPQTLIFDLLHTLSEQFPWTFGDITFRMESGNHYSKQLDEELMHWNGGPLYSTEKGNWYLAKDRADRLLRLLTEKHGAGVIDTWQPVAAVFIRELTTSTAHQTLPRDP